MTYALLKYDGQVVQFGFVHTALAYARELSLSVFTIEVGSAVVHREGGW